MRSTLCCAMVVVVGLFASPVQAGNLPAKFTLGKYVPADAWMYIHGVHNPERAWIDEEWGEVCDAFKQSGIHTDLIELIMSLVGEEQRAEADAHVSKTTELIDGVRWGDLVGGEVVFARTTGMPMLEPVFLTRGPKNSAAANLKGLVEIVNYLGSLSDEVSVKLAKVHGVDVWTLGPTQNKSGMPFALNLFGKGDIIGITLGGQASDDILALMAGVGTKKAVIHNDRFKEALAGIKTPEDLVTFVDFRIMMQGIERIMDSAFTEAGPDEDAVAVRKAVGQGITLCDVVDYMITTMETDGRRELVHTLARMQADKMDSPMARMFLNRQAFKRFDAYIPADATGFSVNGFIDLGLLYRTIITFIEQNVPDGPAHVAQWNVKLAEFGFDPERDVFSWYGGEYISVDVPAAVVTPMSSGDSVLMLRVKDPKLATEKVNAAIAWINTKMQANQQMLMIAPAAVNAEGFQEVTHPMMAMFVRPVIGVKDDWLMIGTSAGAINKCLDVAAGKAPSIVKNERFQKEGIVPSGPVMSASFADRSNLGNEMATIVGMLGMFGGMATAGIPDTPEMHEKKQVIQKLLGIAMKLGPVLQKVDFYSSVSSVTTRDGVVIRTEAVTTYKPPPPKPLKAKAIKVVPTS